MHATCPVHIIILHSINLTIFGETYLYVNIRVISKVRISYRRCSSNWYFVDQL
jgi:hypothetical protein